MTPMLFLTWLLLVFGICGIGSCQEAEPKSMSEKLETTIRALAKGAGFEDAALFERLGDRSFVSLCEPAVVLAKDLGPNSAAFLETQAVGDRSFMSRRLAMLALAALPDKVKAVESLVRVTMNKNTYVAQDAMTAVSYLPEDSLSGACERIIRESAAENDNLAAATSLLLIARGRASEDILKSQIVATKGARIREAFKVAEPLLRKYDELKAPGAVAVWRNYSLLFWRSHRDSPTSISEISNQFLIAKSLSKAGHKFPLDFLAWRLGQGDMLAAAAMGNQKDNEAITAVRSSS